MSQLRFDDSAVRPLEKARGFRLDKTRGKMMGVCAGIANYFGICRAAIWMRKRDNQDENPVCWDWRRA